MNTSIRTPDRNRKGFSTIIAILITAFLTVLSAGILNLIITERATNSFLFDGISAYMRAEWALEYALLKGSNHREGFEDGITITDDTEAKLLTDPSDPKKPHLRYETRAYGKGYTGAIAAGAFEIIPLFYDTGTPMSPHAKNPNKETVNTLVKTLDFRVAPQGDISWNIIGNDPSGRTLGMAGTGWLGQSFGNMGGSIITSGYWKEADATGNMTAGAKTIAQFLSQGYQNNYLILSNTRLTPVEYQISSSNGFSFPVRTIVASSRVGNSKQNIEFTENRSRLFDMLKYSVFSKQ